MENELHSEPLLDDFLLSEEIQTQARLHFAETQTNAAQKIASALEAGNLKRAFLSAHNLHSNAMLLSEEKLTALSKKIEYAIKNNEIISNEQVSLLSAEIMHVYNKIQSREAAT